MPGGDHYFTAQPGSAAELRRLRVTLAHRELEVTTAPGVFSPDRVDSGTGVLLGTVPAPPPGGDLLDLGCGWGPLSLSLALASPHATVWAVDVNERALDLVRRNAEQLGLDNVNALTPEDVPAGLRFQTVWSNPPIRVGKSELHDLLARWLPRLDDGRDAWLVVAKNLGGDSLQRWLQHELPQGFAVHRADTRRGYRVLRVRSGPPVS